MTARIIQFPTGKIVRIPPARQEDVRVTFARMIEQSAGSDVELIDRWAAANLPGRFCEDCLPSDTEKA